MVTPDTVQSGPAYQNLTPIVELNSPKFCLYCMTKTRHPRLGRGETYVCGYKPYRCEVCNYATTTKGNLAIHQQSDKHLNNIQELEQATVGRPMKYTVNTLLECPPVSELSFSPSTTHLQTPGYPEPEKHPPDQLCALTDLSENGVIRESYTYSTPRCRHSVIKMCLDYGDMTNANNLLSTEHFIEKLTETSPFPLACQVCCAFTTDQFDALLKHATINRFPTNQDQVNTIITQHNGGLWLCRLCSYKSALKANFQLHCKTEKHGQRLSVLLHICEGGPANQLRMLSSVNDLNAGNMKLDLTATIAKSNFQNTASIQLACLACRLSTTSAHKFRIHCQCLRHLEAVNVFTGLYNARQEIWAVLGRTTLEPTGSIRSDTRLQNLKDQIVNCSMAQTLSELRVEYVCMCQCGVSVKAIDFQDRKAIEANSLAFDTISKALSHWHSTEHQAKYVRQKESFLVRWRIGNQSGTVDHLTIMLKKILQERNVDVNNDIEAGVTSYSEASGPSSSTASSQGGETGDASYTYDKTATFRSDIVAREVNLWKVHSNSFESFHSFPPPAYYPTDSRQRLPRPSQTRSFHQLRIGRRRSAEESPQRPWTAIPSIGRCDVDSRTNENLFFSISTDDETIHYPKNYLSLGNNVLPNTRIVRSALSESKDFDSHMGSQDHLVRCHDNTDKLWHTSPFTQTNKLDPQSAEHNPFDTTTTNTPSLSATVNNSFTLCQLCATEIPSSIMLLHTAMHFMQLSHTVLPNSQSEPSTGYLGPSIQSADSFYSHFCRIAGMQQTMGILTASIISNKFSSRFIAEESEMAFLLAIEVLAQNGTPDGQQLYGLINEHWFRMNLIEQEQLVSDNKCPRCEKRFVLQSSCELHSRLCHNVSNGDHMTDDQSYFHMDLLREIITTLVRIIPIHTVSDNDDPLGTSHQLGTSLNVLPSLSNSSLLPAYLLQSSNHLNPSPTVSTEALSPNHLLHRLASTIPSMINFKTSPDSFFETESFALNGKSESIDDSLKPNAEPPKRVRTRLTEVQLMVLRSYFDINNSPSDDKLAEICCKTGLQAKVVKHWFRNTLFKERQRNKDNPYNFAVPPSTSLNLEVYEKTGRIEVRPASGQAADPGQQDDPNLTDNKPEILSPESVAFQPTFGNSEASSEGLSIPTDTDSSSVAGFPSTPPAKRPLSCKDETLGRSMSIKRSCVSNVEPSERITSGTNQLVDPSYQTKFPYRQSTLTTTSVPQQMASVSVEHHSLMDVPAVCARLLQGPSHIQPQTSICTTLPTSDTGESELPLDLSTPKSRTTNPPKSPSLPESPFIEDFYPLYNHVNIGTPHVIAKHTPSAGQLSTHPSQHGSTRRNRTSITLLQSKCMHSIYAYHKTPSVHECDRLGAIIGLTRRVVQVWFQNQRAKEKKMARVSSIYQSGNVNTSASITPLAVTPSYCHICCVRLQPETTDTRRFGAEHGRNHLQNTSAMSSHASFVDHLFSPAHLKNMVHRCSVEVNSS